METTGQAIERAFLTAHLLTGNAPLAEDITIRAIESWNPPEEPHEVVFENVLTAALRAPLQQSADNNIANELKPVLLLAPQLRRCFVLRILLGLSAEACAGKLRMSVSRVNHNTCAALHHLCVNLTPGARQAA